MDPAQLTITIDLAPVGIDLLSVMNAEGGWFECVLEAVRAVASALPSGMPPLSLRVETAIAMILSALSLPMLTRM
jgi:16S rRNA U1498 N3-methylase RsmE